VSDTKSTVREAVWDDLERAGVARFPFPPHDRIPNYAGADRAAERLADTDAWTDAETVKANPDAPQLPVRRAALRAGKTLFVAVPRLREPEPFLRIDPGVGDVDAATTVSGVSEYGDPVAPDTMPAVDLVVSGSVAVDPAGGRVGKGEGYADLEFALLAEFDRVGPETTVATTVHERQVLDALSQDDHDVPLDLVVTPERVLQTGTGRARPAGVDWDALSAERLAEIPVLERLAG
jgi:5-formyltetrahydrofolate cyclo-ligase